MSESAGLAAPEAAALGENTVAEQKGPSGAEQGHSLSLVVCISFLVSTLVCLSIVFGYHSFYATRVMTFDLQGYINDQRTLVSGGQISEDQGKANIAALRAKAAALPRNVLVITNDVIMTENVPVLAPAK